MFAAMPIDKAIYGLLLLPILFLAAAILIAAPFYGAIRLWRSDSGATRVRAAWLLLAWLGALTVLTLYFFSGRWYVENSGTRPVSGDELLFAAGLLIFGVLLPGLPFLRLLRNRD
jgi:hypothetical protein